MAVGCATLGRTEGMGDTRCLCRATNYGDTSLFPPIPPPLRLLLRLRPLVFQSPSTLRSGNRRAPSRALARERAGHEFVQPLDRRVAIFFLCPMARRRCPQHAVGGHARRELRSEAGLLVVGEQRRRRDIERHGNPGVHLVDVLPPWSAAARNLHPELLLRNPRSQRVHGNRAAIVRKRVCRGDEHSVGTRSIKEQRRHARGTRLPFARDPVGSPRLPPRRASPRSRGRLG